MNFLVTDQLILTALHGRLYFQRGEGPEWDRSGTGAVSEWDRRGTGVGPEWDRSGTGVGLEWDRSGTGVGPEWDWSGTEEGPVTRPGFCTVVPFLIKRGGPLPVRLFLFL